MKIHSRDVNEKDLEEMLRLLLKEGPNEWNYLTQENIDKEFQLIRDKAAVVVLAEDEKIHGFAVLMLKAACPADLSKYDDLSSIAYICDVVVSLEQSGRGIGSQLLGVAIDKARKEECSKVYIRRHEENLASAGMMRKAGFELVETFLDLKTRDSGSRKTSILAIST